MSQNRCLVYDDAFAGHARVRLTRGSGARTFAFSGWKLESDLAHVVHDEPGGKGAAGFGDKFVHDVGAVLGQEFLSLGSIDGLLEDFLADLELAGALFGLGFFADVGFIGFKNAAAAPGTFAR